MEGLKESEEELNLIDLLRTLWGKRYFVVKVMAAFFTIGLLVAFTSKVEYRAYCKLMPEATDENDPKLGSLGSLAGLAGINLNLGSTQSFSPELYPEIVKSLPFQLEILNDSIYFENWKTKTSVHNFFLEKDRPGIGGYIIKYTLGLPGVIKAIFVSDEINNSLSEREFIRFSKADWELIEGLRNRISVDLNSESGIIAITAEMPDPYAAAELTNNIVVLLTEKVTEYRIEKIRNTLKYVTSSYMEAKDNFERVQLALASASDKNLNLSSATAQIEFQKLQSEYDLAFEVYKGLATRLEQAKLELKEQTPLFTILEPVRIPEDKSSPNRILILVLFILFGAGLSSFLVIFRHYPKLFGVGTQNDQT